MVRTEARTADPEFTLCQIEARKTAQLIKDIISHPGLRHLARHTSETPYSSITYKLFPELLGGKTGVVLLDQYSSQGMFPEGMDTLVSAAEMTPLRPIGKELEDPRSETRTIIWLASDNFLGMEHYNVAVLRMNPYRRTFEVSNRGGYYTICSNNISHLNALKIVTEGENGYTYVSLNNQTHVSGYANLPSDSSDSYSGSLTFGSFGDIGTSLERIRVLAVVCQGVNTFLSRFIQQNIKTGWDKLPAVGTY